MQSPSRYAASALERAGDDARRLAVGADARGSTAMPPVPLRPGRFRVIIKPRGLRCSVSEHMLPRHVPEDMESPYAVKDEFESLLESIRASTASSPWGGTSRAPLGVESGRPSDAIHEAHET